MINFKKERFSELEDISSESLKPKEQRKQKTKNKNTAEYLRTVGQLHIHNMYVMRIAEGKKREKKNRRNI